MLRAGKGYRGLPPLAKNFLKKARFSGFEVKKQHFLIVEGLALHTALN